MICEECQLNLGAPEPISACAPCGHLFHEGCIRDQLLRSNSCPCCGVAVKNLRTIFLELPAVSEVITSDQRKEMRALSQKLLLSQSRLEEEKQRTKRAQRNSSMWNDLARTTKENLDEKRAKCAELERQLKEPSLVLVKK